MDFQEITEGPLDGAVESVVTRRELEEIVDHLSNLSAEDRAFLGPKVCDTYCKMYREAKEQLDAAEGPLEGWDEREFRILFVYPDPE
jgi:hypothetical protein